MRCRTISFDMQLQLTPKQRDLIRHAIGLSAHSKITYRNHFVIGPGSEDYGVWMELVSKGLAKRADGSAISGGMDVFWATREAALAVRRPDEHLDREFRD